MSIEDAQADILAQAQRQKNRRYLWVGELSAEAPENMTVQLLEQAKADSNHYDVVILEAELPSDVASAMSIISHFRDVVASKVIVLYRDHHLSVQDFIDLGFIRLDLNGQVFGYDLYNYRQTPDWLNAKNWANPERFDKERW